MEILSRNVMQTEKMGADLAEYLLTKGFFPAFVAMYGDLGAGKTAFVRGFTSVLSPGSRVKSPTYTIVNEYRKGRFPVFHFDLYRITDEEDLYGIGFDEYVESGYCIAEWCENIGTAIPQNAIVVKIEKVDDLSRRIMIHDTTGYTIVKEEE